MLKAMGVGMMVLTAAAVLGCGARAQSASGESAQHSNATVRQQAEALAEAASHYFGEVLKQDRVAQAPSQARGPAQTPAARLQNQAQLPQSPSSNEDLWAAALRWIAHSSQVHQALMRQLSQGETTTALAPAQPSQTASQPTVPAPRQPASVVAEAQERTDQAAYIEWLTVSAERFQALMGKLSRPTSPSASWDPVADAEKRTGQHKRAGASTIPERQTPAAPNVGTRASPANSDGATPALPLTVAEERRLAEIRRADADKRAEEGKKTQDVLRPPRAKQATDANKRSNGTAPEAAATSQRMKAAAVAKTAADASAAKVAPPDKVKDGETAKAGDKNLAPSADKALKMDNGEQAKADAPDRRQRVRPFAAPAAVDDQRLAQAATPALNGEPQKALKLNPAEMTRKAKRRRKVDAHRTPARTKQTSRATSTPSAQTPSPPQSGTAMAGEVSPAAAAPRGLRGHHHGGSSASCAAAGNTVGLPGWYVVKEGDTLWSIAQRYYGAGRRYKRIFAANRTRVHKPHWIYPCQQLYLTRPAHRT